MSPRGFLIVVHHGYKDPFAGGGRVYVIDVNSGRMKWTYDADFSITAGPLLHSEYAIIGGSYIDEQHFCKVLNFDAMTGDVNWNIKIESHDIYQIQSVESILFVVGSGFIDIIDILNGKRKLRIDGDLILTIEDDIVYYLHNENLMAYNFRTIKTIDLIP